VRLQGSLHPGWRSAPSLSTDHWQDCQKEKADTSHRLHSQPCREVYRRDADELGELSHQ
jgi:hypothetical protein